ncbi:MULTISPECIES: dioxygenase family protein [Streptomyces]|nr:MULTISPECIES: dioxygenase [Streptomyces]
MDSALSTTSTEPGTIAMTFADEDDITESAARRWATARPGRAAEVMSALVRHLHAFAREVRLTEDELTAAADWLAAAGHACDGERQEFVLASDVLGLSRLVVQLDDRLRDGATPATLMGPFHIDGSPTVPYGHDMSGGAPGEPLFLTGTVTDTDGKPLTDVVLDVWHADADGAYTSRIPESDEVRLRAKYRTRQDGTFCVRTIVPRAYSIPMDGPVGALVRTTDIDPHHAPHIHCLVDHPGHEKLVTILYQQDSEFLDSNVVFATRPELITAFTRHPPGPAPDGSTLDRPFRHATYDFVLQPRADGRR